jgi:hypothetical protein
MRNKCIVLAASVAQKPLHGGHTWVFLQYLLGFKRLGCDVLLIDRLDPECLRGSDGIRCAAGESAQCRFLSECLGAFGLGGDFTILLGGDKTFGLNRSDVLDKVSRCSVLLNFMGYLRDEDILAAAALTVYVDIDPGFAQMWKAAGLHDSLAGHDAFVTVGRNVGAAGCLVPDLGLNWIGTAPPVVLEQWPASGLDGPITSVASWRSTYAPVNYQGRSFGLRVHEFRRFMSLPRSVRAGIGRFELALDIHPDETRDIEALQRGGWVLADPLSVAGNAQRYREYIASSSAEFCVAKNMYVQARTGWFSDRSVCYLASGKPVLAQETGWSAFYPSGEGLLKFSEPDEAVAAIETVFSDIGKHSRRALDIAREYFDSDRVLPRLLHELGVE